MTSLPKPAATGSPSCLAHQHLGQLPPELRAALSANARNKLYFPVSPEDAHQLERHTLPELGAYDFAHLTGFTVAARLVIDGNNTPAFTLRTLPAPPAITGRADVLRNAVTHQQPETRRRPASLSGRPPDAPSDAAIGVDPPDPFRDPFGDPVGDPFGDPTFIGLPTVPVNLQHPALMRDPVGRRTH